MKHWAILTGSGTSDLKEIDFCTSLDRVTLTPVKMTHAMGMENAEIWYVINVSRIIPYDITVIILSDYGDEYFFP